jgi:hypothetical protein
MNKNQMREGEEGKEEKVALPERTALEVEMVASSSLPRVLTPSLAAPPPLHELPHAPLPMPPPS